MNGKQSKKIRKAVNKKIRYDLIEVVKILSAESFWNRLKYSFRIVFKYKLGEGLKVNNG